MASHVEAARATGQLLLQQFREQLRVSTVTPARDEGQPYVRTKGLVNWMNSTGPDAAGPIGQRLLGATYMAQGNQYGPEIPITYNKVCEEQNRRDRCIIAFCILLEIGLGHLIHHVQQEDIVDLLLPMTLKTLEEKFKWIDERNSVEYARRFNRAQWKYFPLTFTHMMNKNFPEERVFPICRKVEIGKGGQARVFQILVQEEYVDPKLQAMLSRDEHTWIQDNDFGPCFQLALKTFESAQYPYWANEKDAFHALRGNKGMIQCLGFYAILHSTPAEFSSSSQKSQFREMNILLEYGRFDLMRMFQYRLPPVNSPEVEGFWRSLIEVVDALKGIHNIRTQNGRYNGWHNDIKPENVIVVNGKYKLADPGFAKFQKILEENAPLPTIIAHGGTATYAAPERYARQSNARIPVSQSVDLWSVGCIFSMAATWVVLGYPGVSQFDHLRQRAISDIIQRSPSESNEPKIMEGDFFHDGLDVLHAVKDWHTYLRAAVRQTDHVTRKMLDFTEKYLLIKNRTMSAKELYLQLQKLLDECDKEEIPEGLESLMEALLELDEGAQSIPAFTSSHATASVLGSVPQKHPDKAISRLEVPGQLLKTASRYESLSKLSAARPPKVTANVHRTTDHEGGLTKVSEGEDQQHFGKRRPTSMPPHLASIQRMSTIKSVRTDDGRIPDPTNVIQAHEQLTSGTWFKKLSPKEDQFVKTYFGNRDIKFLVDNSTSMVQYWPEAVFLLETLVMMAKKSDKDGMDLYFTVPEQRSRNLSERPFKAALEGEKDESQFRRTMLGKHPRKALWAGTDMITPIRSIFDDFFNALDEQKKPKTKSKWPKKGSDGPKALTLLIFTNGIWQGMEDPDAINDYMEGLLKELEMRGLAKNDADRFVSIEFIQFGDDPTVTERLRALDDGMEFKGYQ
ncbi:hypothetical protein BU23DRAFT_154737 [Bimuria novae-zelandiae CBS 107.79]|uniref:Protein kinase domain-containing protein n=1 Tax=Bimuria novae-zelandiae CBS 107.79 TaxID=1447943 RepID=A0A6A5VX22_9PLEO|nr:hypothetical protein BU23DRAFT_154737 [Bimuria novae-zelandiae CBS 107.79]